MNYIRHPTKEFINFGTHEQNYSICMWSKIKLAIILVHKIIINWIIWPDQNWIRCRSAEAIGWNWLSSQNLNAHFSYRAPNRIRRSIMQNLSWYILLHKTKIYLHHYCYQVPNSGISKVQLCTANVRRRNMLEPCRAGFTNHDPFSCKTCSNRSVQWGKIYALRIGYHPEVTLNTLELLP